MKVICPKCQFENQADTPRVVCARCATIIEVRPDQGTGLDLNLDINGKRQTARLPFASNSGGNQPSNSQPFNGGQLTPPRDVYATRIGDEFDDVLDIPGQTPANYRTNYESSPVFDDVFATPGYEATTPFDFSTPDPKSSPPPIESYSAGIPRQRETRDYVSTPEPEFMGWPVLPENALDEEEPANGFSASRGGLLTRIILGALVFGGLVFGAYYLLGDLISKRKDQAENLGNPPSAVKPSAAAPITETKPVETAKLDNSTQAKTTTTPPVIDPKPPADAKQKPSDVAKGAIVPITPVKDNKDNKDNKVVGPTGPTKPAPPAVAPPAPTKGNLTIQVASFNDQAQANDRVARLRAAGVDARVVRADIPGKGLWYRVQIGGFGTREEAMSYGNQLRSKGAVQDFIVTTVGK